MKQFYIFVLINIIRLHQAAVVSRIEDKFFWHNAGMKHLKKTLDLIESKTPTKARNIILFLGDGMGMTTVTAGRIFKGQLKNHTGEEETLVFEDFPHTGFAKTYNTDRQVPDSAGTATAIFTGVKTKCGVIGMDSTTTPTDSERGRLDSIMEWAIREGKRIGLVTTTRVTHATPASLYARVNDRDWECDSKVPKESSAAFKDIARQLVEDSPGKHFNVILGGGLSLLGDTNIAETKTIEFDGDTEHQCSRIDGRNLTDAWIKSKSPGSAALVKTRTDLLKIDPYKVDHLMGLFRNNHITYSIARQPEEPTISEMVEQAIRVLNRQDSNGYVLMVEGGRIDQAHHQNYAHAAVKEVFEFDAAVDVALSLTDSKETLIMVTADHSHSFTLNGYAARGNDILGFANKRPDILPYETLTYANGPGFWEHRTNNSNSKYGTWLQVEKLDPQSRSSPTYKHLATFPMNDETHGGEDVPVYAYGPGAHLIRGTFEQNYLAYVMSYAGCIGPARDLNGACFAAPRKSSSIRHGLTFPLLLIVIIYELVF